MANVEGTILIISFFGVVKNDANMIKLPLLELGSLALKKEIMPQTCPVRESSCPTLTFNCQTNNEQHKS